MILNYYQIKRSFCTILIIAFLIGLQSFSFAQSGKITGLVTDASNGEALFGANVLIEGTSIGASTDFDGEFVIPIVPYGTHNVIIRYIGYEEQSIVVEINENYPEKDIKIALISEMIEGETVTVTAQAQGQMGAINQQLTANTIKNVVSAEKIHQLPDGNAATALSRLPGVSLMNGGQVVIRGVQAKQNLILVNGVQLPSTDMNTRATGLGFISSNMLSGIEVVKVVTPDMDANVIGGTVNLRLREAPVNFHADVLAEGSYNNQDKTSDNYKFWASLSNRYFDDKFGVFIQGNANRFNGGNDQTVANYERYESLPYGEAPYRMSTFNFEDQENRYSNLGGSIILDYQLPKGSILMQNTISSAEYDNAQHNVQYNFINNQINFIPGRNKFNRTLYVNALQADYDFDLFKVDFLLSHSFSDQGTDLAFGSSAEMSNFTNVSDPAPFGYDAEGNPISYSNKRNTLTVDEVYGITPNMDNYLDSQIQRWCVLQDRAFQQHIYNSNLDFTIPVVFSPYVTSEFKVGGKYTRTTRTNDVNRWYQRTGDDSFYEGVRNFIPGRTLSNTDPILFGDLWNSNYSRGKEFFEGRYNFNFAFDIDKTDRFFKQSRDGWGVSIHREGSTIKDFSGTEYFSAAYMMGTFNIGARLNIIAGARYEHYNMDYKATNFYTTHPVDGNGIEDDSLNTADRSDDNFLPNIQVRYKITKWMDVRAAYTQTLSRPDYNALMPNILFSEGNTNIAGNPYLKPTVSNNLDLYLSFYNNEIGLFTVGGFYKKMDDVFFGTSVFYQNLDDYNAFFPDSSYWESQGIRPPGPAEKINTFLNNPNPAYVQGLEFDWQTNFWYLPEPFNSLVFNINYTRVWSEMDYQQIRNIPIREKYVDPITGRTKFRTTYSTTDTVRTARLLNQANDILNIALGVDYKGFSGRISFNMQGNVITNVGGRPEEDRFTGNIYKWDFTLKQELPIDGLSVQLSGVNIFHNPTKTYRQFRRELGAPIGEYLARTAYSPTIYSLNLRYIL